MKNLVLLSYGNEAEWKRAVFTVLSFYSWFEGDKSLVRVLIYTDSPEFFKTYLFDFDITYVYFPLDEIKRNREKHAAPYRLKITVVDETFKTYPDDDLLYLDTDTFFVANPKSLLNSLVPGQSFLHLREYPFDVAVNMARWESTPTHDFQQYPRAFIDLIESNTFRIGQQEVSINRFQYMWNAGVIGLAKNMAKHIADVFALTDEFYAHSKWRLSEQIAFTVVLESVSNLSEAKKYLDHYWPYKERVDIRMNEVITDNFKKLSVENKKLVIKKFTTKLSKFLYHEMMITSTRDSFREKDYTNGLKYASKAFFAIPLNDDLIKIIKFRFAKHI